MEWVKISPISFENFWANLDVTTAKNIILIIDPSVRKLFLTGTGYAGFKFGM